MPTIEPYLYFNGNAAEAMRWYAEVLGADPPVIMTYGEAPADSGTGQPVDRDRVMHSIVKVEGASIMAADVPTGMPYDGIKGVSVAIAYKTAAEAEVLYKQLSAGAKSINAPLTQTFFADAFAMLTDRYGVSWVIMGGSR